MPVPTTDIDPRYGEPDATPTPWETTEQRLADAEVYWLSTVRPDGRPHVTSLISVWRGGAAHVCAGPHERKARNLAENPHVVLTTGTPDLHGGLDVVVEGRVERVTDTDELKALAAAWEEKYGVEWHFDVLDGGFEGGGGLAYVYRIEPTTAFAFGKAPYSQTRYRFAEVGR
ncbi:pyridoxamine 5'-phosphate oxidase family protein [Pseudonocardia lacus]|uniref:pyridoxamine 5'-phosphate oxidase family protein n=1 Tax=Pseudonocardia lacus TaxID=2835865 RepID=UPI001BDCE0EF|nr:pyridoxamine 5'-phosphate oxidase family protein [Pseudonocardia lacus]